VPAGGGPTVAEAEPAYVFADSQRRRKLESAFPAIEAAAQEEAGRQHIPGLVVGVVIDGELAYAKGFGVADLETKTKPDADTVYRIGSITKSFTALALLSLRDEGALALDDPLTRLLPEARGLVYPTRDSAPLTLRQLLTHTSGLSRQDRLPPPSSERPRPEKEVIDSLAGLPLANVPGTTFEYSNLGFVLLGLAVGRAAHMTFRDAVTKRLLAPLGMTSTFWDPADVPAGRLATSYRPVPAGPPQPFKPILLGASAGAGGLFSSVRDMARYLAFELGAYPPRNAPESGPVRRSTVRESHATGFKTGLRVRLEDAPMKGDSLVDSTADAYGFGWSAQQTCDFDTVIRHNGGIDGFATLVVFLPKHGVGVIVFTNLFGAVPDVVAKRTLDALRRGGGLIQRTPALAPEFEGAMKRFLAVYNSWDESAYGAMLSKGRDKDPSEQEELAGYKKLHGACKGYAPIEAERPRAGRFRMDCERGTLELSMQLGADGLITGFLGTSRDLPIEPDLKKVADRVVGLVGKWDDGAYRKHLAPKSTKTRDETVKEFDALRSMHGACTVKSATRAVIRGAFDRRLELSCERGGDMSLVLHIDPKDANAVAAYWFEASAIGTCPVR